MKHASSLINPASVSCWQIPYSLMICRITSNVSFMG
jgi:hypothetical protein